MTVEIDFENSRADPEEGQGALRLHDPDKDENYWSWDFYADEADRREYEENFSSATWKWENPDDPLENITLSPSLLLSRDEPNTFHIFVRNGGIQHCGDCQCGCKD